MSRSYCPNCHYPERTCVCHAIDRTEYSIQLTIFQHPSEAGHAKNTARLISLVAEGVKIIVGESPEDFDEVREELLSNQGTVVLFPASTSISLSAAHKNSSINKLLLIDGTWLPDEALNEDIVGFLLWSPFHLRVAHVKTAPLSHGLLQ